MGVAKDYFEAEYPLNTTAHPRIVLSGDHANQVQQLINADFIGKIQTYRAFPFDPTRQLFPIPQSELDGNSGLSREDQNPGY
jgi:hypothetical protein